MNQRGALSKSRPESFRHNVPGLGCWSQHHFAASPWHGATSAMEMQRNDERGSGQQPRLTSAGFPTVQFASLQDEGSVRDSGRSVVKEVQEVQKLEGRAISFSLWHERHFKKSGIFIGNERDTQKLRQVRQPTPSGLPNVSSRWALLRSASLFYNADIATR